MRCEGVGWTLEGVDRERNARSERLNWKRGSFVHCGTIRKSSSR